MRKCFLEAAGLASRGAGQWMNPKCNSKALQDESSQEALSSTAATKKSPHSALDVHFQG
jgi:hypothetical protein